MRRRLLLIAIVTTLLASAVPAGVWASSAAALPANFEDTLVTTIDGPATALAFTPSGSMLVGSKLGKLSIYEGGTLRSAPALDLGPGGLNKLCSYRERGLLGVAVDPAFTTNRYVYLYYTLSRDGTCVDSPTPVNRVSRFVLPVSGTINPASEKVLVDGIPSPHGWHNAGDVQFGKDGYLYVSTGDGACDYEDTTYCGPSNDAARDRHALVGKVLRVTRDGLIPPSNPYMGTDSDRCGEPGGDRRTTRGRKCKEIYAYGLRNPFRLAFDPNAAGTRFYINDVGAARWEEIDLGISGADYGWNVREGHCATATYTQCGPQPAGMTNPIFDYRHDTLNPDGTTCRAATGGAFVPNGAWPSEFDNTYLYGDYVCARIFKLARTSTGAYVSREFSTTVGGPIHMAFGPHDAGKALYYTNYRGQVRRVAYSVNRRPTAVATGSPDFGPLPLQVTFDGGGSSDPDGDALRFEWDFTSDGTVDATGSTATHTYRSAGIQYATLRVSDNSGASDTARVRVDAGNTPPSPSITAPASGTRFYVGERLTLTGGATDAEDGNLPASALTWTVTLRHGSHSHPYLSPTPGNNIALTAPAPEELAATTNSYLLVEMTATDSQGATRMVTRELRPRLVSLTFATQPSGLKLQANERVFTAPRTLVSWERFSLRLSAPAQLDSQGRKVEIVAWSDGGTPAHTIVTPAAATTYTATLKAVTTLTVAASPTLVNYNGRTTLSGTLTTTAGPITGRGDIAVWRSGDGGRTWKQDGRAIYDAVDGRYEAVRSATSNTLFQLRFPGDAEYKASVSGRQLVQSKAYLPTPSTPDSVARNAAFATSGYLKPYHAGSTPLYFERYTNGAWQPYATKSAPNAEYQGYTKYTLDGYSLPTAGRWRVRAYHSDASHAATWSPWRYFTVR